LQRPLLRRPAAERSVKNSFRPATGGIMSMLVRGLDVGSRYERADEQVLKDAKSCHVAGVTFIDRGSWVSRAISRL
jgi:hypothetical protein